MGLRFELGLIRPTRLGLGLILAIAAVFALVAVIINHLQHSDWQAIAGIVTLLGGGFIAYRLLKSWVRYAVVVLVKANGITIQYISDGREVVVPFASLASYRHESYNGGQQLHLKLTNGQKLKLSANNTFGKVGEFGGMVQALEQATTNCRNENAAVIVREPGFFEKPVSTIILVVLTALYGLIFWKIVHDDRPVQGNIITSIGAYVTYLGAWLAASKRRSQAR